VTGELGRERLRLRWVLAGLAAVVAAAVAGLLVGPVNLPPLRVLATLLDHLPAISLDAALPGRAEAIVWELRAPRVALALLVGAALAVCGGAYQGVFRNPLADPYLLGVAAGAGLGATVAITAGMQGGGALDPVPVAAFAGALGAVMLTYVLGAAGDQLRSPAVLVLAGVAIASFLTALQTYVQQRNTDQIREVYSWILGRLAVAGWREVAVLAPYTVISLAVLLAHRRSLDVLRVGDEEAESLGLHPKRIRLVVVLAASLGTAAAVSVSGLIGFVGVIVPHTVRLLAGTSYRVILPLSVLFGAAFLTAADLLARTAVSPGELPIGVVTAFFGAPFFVLVLRTSRRSLG
jgi:iron complex transport system permease protein